MVCYVIIALYEESRAIGTLHILANSDVVMASVPDNAMHSRVIKPKQVLSEAFH